MRHLITKTVLLIIFFLCVNFLSAQVVIGDVNLSVPLNVTECSTLTVGQTIQFIRTSNCTGNILITLDGAEVLNTTDISPSYTFASVGQYIVFCGAAPNAVATPKICYTVPETIPALGEWGLICLFLLVLIVVSASFEKKQVIETT